MNNEHLHKDADGNIIVKPITGWTTTAVAGTSVLLAVQYVETPAELETGDSSQIQLLLTAQRCLELADALKRLAQSLIEDQSRVN
jgi:hypothetical protein